MKKKVVLITGASRGIGKATAEEFAKKGYNIIINYNNSSKEAEDLSKNLIDAERTSSLGGRLSVKLGDAQIYCSVDGIVKAYDIKIIKANKQSHANDKSMTIKVTDKELLNKTGGIIQGMSGSPIVQNGKIIGAVTHVLTSDPTRGYGVYIDWMIDN